MTATPVSLLDLLKLAKPDAVDGGVCKISTSHSFVRGCSACRRGDEAKTRAGSVSGDFPRAAAVRAAARRLVSRLVAADHCQPHPRFVRQRQRTPGAGASEGADAFLTQLEDPASDLSKQWDLEHDRHVLEQLLKAIEPDFAASTWNSFREFAIKGQPAAAVAAKLGTSENSVLLAKSRVLKRLRGGRRIGRLTPDHS